MTGLHASAASNATHHKSDLYMNINWTFGSTNWPPGAERPTGGQLIPHEGTLPCSTRTSFLMKFLLVYVKLFLPPRESGFIEERRPTAFSLRIDRGTQEERERDRERGGLLHWNYRGLLTNFYTEVTGTL